MSGVRKRLRKAVVQRAANRCEYCQLSQSGQAATFHIDHIIPQCDGGETTLDNLALACVSCSLRKEARRCAADPVTGRLVRFFHPRMDSWRDHFDWKSVFLIARTPIARATIEALDLNRPIMLAIREEQAYLGRHPPPDL
jgi:HNH endonuclease